MDYEQQDPNAEREEVPFPTQYGPPRFPQAPPIRPPDQQVQPHRGNGHFASYVAPNEVAYAQAVLAQAAAQAANGGQGYTAESVGQPYPQQATATTYHSQTTGLVGRLEMVRLAADAGAFQLAQVWAEQLQVFKNHYLAKHKTLLADREALDLIVGPLIMAIED